MQVLHPAFLWLGLLAVLPILLYLFRRRSRTVPVSTLVFFKSLAREHRESAWLRHLKKILSLLLTLAMLAAAVLALSRIVVAPRSGAVKGVVVLLDRSASMDARDADAAGRTRLEAAVEAIGARLAALPETVPVALLAYDSRVDVLESRTTNRRALLRALENVRVRPVAGDPEAALEAAARIAALETPSVIWHATDRPEVAAGEAPDPGRDDADAEADAAVAAPGSEPDPAPTTGAGDAEDNAVAAGAESPPDMAPDEDEAADSSPAGRALAPRLPDGVRLETIALAVPEPVNVGITAFQVRPVPLEHGRFEAYVQVALNADAPEPVEAELRWSVGAGVPVPRRFDLDPGGRQGLILPLEGASDQLLHLEVRAPGDVLGLDNEIVARLPESRPVIVRWISADPDPFTRIALSAIAVEGELDIWQAGPDAWPLAEEVDVVIFDGWLPPEWPADVPAIVINPPGSCGPVQAVPVEGGGIPHESVRLTNPDHPVLFRISSGRIALTQTAVIDASGSIEPLWFAGREPVLAAGEVAGQRLVVMAFAPQRSERLPLTASYPLLLGNAIFWCSGTDAGEGTPLDLATGGLLAVADGESMRWQTWADGRLDESWESVEAAGFVELDRVGLWETTDGRRGSSLLLSREETDVPGPLADDEADEGVAPTAEGAPSSRSAFRFGGELTRALLAGLVLVLLVESWLFHRHAVY